MAAKGFKERVLIPALTEQDFSVREARVVIDAIFDSIKGAKTPTHTTGDTGLCSALSAAF